MNVTALVPAHNEGTRIADTVRAIARVGAIDTILVIDDGSSDGTSSAAEQAGAQVLRLERNVGKGAALDAGLALVEPQVQIVVLLDGDLGDSADQAGLLLAPVIDGAADMSIAMFPRPTKKAGFGLVMRVARAGIVRLGGPFEANAPLSGQRALNRTALDVCTPFAFGYGVEVALTVRALRAGLRIVEVPTTMTHAATGRNLQGFIHRGRQFLHVVKALARLALERPGT